MELITALARHDSQYHPHFSANSINLNEAAETTDVNMHIISNTSLEQEPPHPPTTVTLDQSITIGNEEGGGVTDNDPNTLGKNEQQTTRLNGSNVAPYGLTMVLSLLGFLFFGLKQKKHTPLHIANPFVLLAVVGSGIAYMTFSILSFINDRPDYKMLKGIYYIGCNMAFISLLLMLFTTT